MESEITISKCRLCLAPEKECVPIFSYSSAEPLSLSVKIQACVSIKINETDRLSSRVCHACISYLNSWQSFKNRCLAAQKKQRTWLFLMTEKEKLQKQHAATQVAAAAARRQLHQQIQKSILNYTSLQDETPYQTLPSTPKNSAPPHMEQEQPPTKKPHLVPEIDISCVKEEPQEIISDEEGRPTNLNVEIDPTEFLAHNVEDDEEDNDDYSEREPIPQPIMTMEEMTNPILTSLGLTHINHVNPYNYLSAENGGSEDAIYNQQDSKSTIFPANCSVCDMKFSSRANARRHERNIHGFNPRLGEFGPSPLQSMNFISSKASALPNIQITPPKSSSQRKSAVVVEVFDYTHPENYRHHLTENKIRFIRKNMTFLEQYQDMTCACCDKQYQTYKAFMSHMRKKYQFLPRNLCFKCLRQFETKGQFIAHLKKKNCINLHRLYLSDNSIQKPPMTEDEQLRQKTKDMLANKVYGCKLCGVNFRLKMDFRAHVYEIHADESRAKDFPLTVCGFCNSKFDDPVARKRHYTNLECINMILCGTCGEKFEMHNSYIDHVYNKHLGNQRIKDGEREMDYNDTDSFDGEFDMSNCSPTSNLRTPQNCPVCGKQYNNYYNVLRHMESKHPDQLPKTYTCDYCKKGFPRQCSLREHMKLFHAEIVYKPQIPLLPALLKLEATNQFNCTECGHTAESKDDWIDHMRSHSKFVCPQCDYHTENKDEHENHLATHLKFKLYSCAICKHSFNTEKGLETHMEAIHNQKGDHNGDQIQTDGIVTIKQEKALDMDDSHGTGNEIFNNETENLIPKVLFKPNHEKAGPPSEEIPAVQRRRECPVCKAMFTIGAAFANHIKTHQIPENKSLLQRLNLPSHPTVKRLRCRVCQKRINTKLGLKRHMLIAHQIKDYSCVKCYMCPAEFSNHKGLRVHLLRSHQITKEEDEQNQQERALNLSQSNRNSYQQQPQKQSPAVEHHECNVCHTVYRNRQDLRVHAKTVHGIENLNDDDGSDDKSTVFSGIDAVLSAPKNPPALNDVWFQCRYCNETFNSSKRLTLHMNTHDEHDQTDYSCKDCGSVYISRKSLWVHRYKKHPRPPNYMVCEICKKTFFDKTELFYHMKTHSQQGLMYIQQQNLTPPTPRYLQIKQEIVQQGQAPSTTDASVRAPVNKPAAVNFDGSIFSQNSSMASALDESGNDSMGEYSRGLDNVSMVNGEYACDLCPKTFAILNALHVHRGWHFRSPSGRQVTDPSQTWQPDSIPPSKLKRMRNPYGSPPVCPYCTASFASTNNLRRHIVEVHKRVDVKDEKDFEPENGVFIEKVRECQSCNMTFKTTSEWIDHKITHARNQKPSSTFEWNCEICGKMFTRKERLLQHMITHLNSQEFDSEGILSQILSSGEGNTSQGGNNFDSTNDNSMDPCNEINFESNSQSSESSMSSQENDDDDQEMMSGDEDHSSASETPRLSCELCQKVFTTTSELRVHVSNHILNGLEEPVPTSELNGGASSTIPTVSAPTHNFHQLANIF